MSGRTKWWRNGQRVTGYRKTDRRNPRRRVPAGPMEYTLHFQLPEALAWSTRAGRVSSFVEVDGSGVVTVRSLNAGVTRQKAAEFLLAIAAGLDVNPVNLGRMAVTKPRRP